MGQSSHYFIALPVSSELKEKFLNWQEQSQDELSYKIWPHQADLHITLKFLGAVDQENLEKLRVSLRSIDQPKFSVTVGSIGTFGKQDKPRVLWAGVENNNLLDDLYKKVELVATSVGFNKEDRPYRPHITLAKKWNGSHEQAENLKAIKENYDKDRFHMNVEEFVLYQIFPSKSPKYENVETFYLRG
jgi:RNA 2',3'-cyclic 3'-phosphodiesterase